MSRLLRSLSRLAISVLLVTFLVWRYPVSWEEIRDTFQQADLWLLALSILMLPNQLLLSSLKWQLVLRSHGIRLPFSTLFRSYMIGTFLGSLLPTGYVGDLARMADVGKVTGRRLESISAVILERASGLAALAAIGAVASFKASRVFEDPAFNALGLSFVAVLGALVIAFVPGVAELMRDATRRLPWSGPRRAVESVATSILHYRSRPGLLARVLALSFLFQILAYTIVYVHARTLRLPVPYTYCLVFVPVMSLAEALPISVAGIGPRESALVFFLGRIGIHSSDVLSLSILILSARYLINAVGGLLLLFRPSLEPLTKRA